MYGVSWGLIIAVCSNKEIKQSQNSVDVWAFGAVLVLRGAHCAVCKQLQSFAEWCNCLHTARCVFRGTGTALKA